MDEYVDHYLKELRGWNCENACFSLLEADNSCLPLLIQAYYAETRVDVSAMLVEIIWQHRQPETLGFLAEVLQEPHRELWRAALDGIVTLGGRSGLDILKAEKERLLEKRDRSERIEWIDEVAEQIALAMKDK